MRTFLIFRSKWEQCCNIVATCIRSLVSVRRHAHVCCNMLQHCCNMRTRVNACEKWNFFSFFHKKWEVVCSYLLIHTFWMLYKVDKVLNSPLNFPFIYEYYIIRFTLNVSYQFIFKVSCPLQNSLLGCIFGVVYFQHSCYDEVLSSEIFFVPSMESASFFPNTHVITNFTPRFALFVKDVI